MGCGESKPLGLRPIHEHAAPDAAETSTKSRRKFSKLLAARALACMKQFDSGGISDMHGCVKAGHIKFLRIDWVLNQPEDWVLCRRQDLETLKPSPFLDTQTALALLADAPRAIASVSYAWAAFGAPDPTGSRLRATKAFLRAHPELELVGLFWDYCRYVPPRAASPPPPAALPPPPLIDCMDPSAACCRDLTAHQTSKRASTRRFT